MLSELELRSIIEGSFLPKRCECTKAEDASLTIKVYVDHVLERAAGGRKDGVKVVEREAHLGLQLGFGRAIGLAAHLARDEQKTVRPDRWRVAVLFIERLTAGGKNNITCRHEIPICWWERIDSRRSPPSDKQASRTMTLCDFQTIALM